MPWSAAGKDVGATSRHFFEYLGRPLSQRDSVLPLGFHALSRNDPSGSRKVYLRRRCANYFRGAGAGQYRKFERCRANPAPAAQLGHEVRQAGIREGRMVFDRRQLGAGRQHVAQVSTPASRVFAAIVITARLGPIQHGLDP